MKIDQELTGFLPENDSVLAIGVFDGVHRGHQYLVSQLVSEAAATGRQAGVVTFRNHPADALRSDISPQYLMPMEERVALIKEIGVDFVVPITFDQELAALHAREFASLLKKHLRMCGLVTGPNFAMGHKREGDIAALTILGAEMGFSLRVVNVFLDRGESVSSTTIRQTLALGDITRVSALLGRNFTLTGMVVKGMGRGTVLGFPTANLQMPTKMAVPRHGIYATWARLGGEFYMAATSIGTRPTFGETEATVEAFMLDFEGDLYGRDIRLEFVQRLRDEVKYDSAEALVEQVNRDVNQTKAVLLGSSTELA